LRVNLEPRLERILVFGELERRLPALEQSREQLREMSIDLLERPHQPRAPLIVQSRDRPAQFGDRRRHLVFLTRQRSHALTRLRTAPPLTRAAMRMLCRPRRIARNTRRGLSLSNAVARLSPPRLGRARLIHQRLELRPRLNRRGLSRIAPPLNFIKLSGEGS